MITEEASISTDPVLEAVYTAPPTADIVLTSDMENSSVEIEKGVILASVITADIVLTSVMENTPVKWVAEESKENADVELTAQPTSEIILTSVIENFPVATVPENGLFQTKFSCWFSLVYEGHD